jgi:hypothetical protein
MISIDGMALAISLGEPLAGDVPAVRPNVQHIMYQRVTIGSDFPQRNNCDKHPTGGGNSPTRLAVA